jgi:iron complex outermembrane receptor protein
MVINIITYSAETFQGTEVTGRLGAIEEFYSGEVKHGQKFDDNDGGVFAYAGVGKYVGASKFDAPQIFPFTFPESSYGTTAGEPFTNAGINRDGAENEHYPPLKVHIQLNRDDWDIWGRLSRGGKQFLWAPGLWAPPPWGYADSEPYVTNNNFGYQEMTGYIGRKQELSKDIDIDCAFSYETFDFAEFRQNEVDDAYREDEYFGKAILQWQPNDQHKIAFGSEVFHRELGMRNPGWPDVSPISQAFKNNSLEMPRWSTNMFSLLGEWQWNINEKWTTFLGGRVDDHTYTDRMISPRAAIVHSPTDRDTFKLMWSRSVRANMEEEMKVQALTGGGNSKPEKLDSIELRYERQQSKNLDLAASVFVHYNLRLVDWSQTASSTTNVGTQREYGLEFEASYHTEKTRLAVSHSYTKLYSFTLDDPETITFVSAKPYGFGNDLASWSNHLTKLTAQHKLDDKWTLDASMRIYWGFPGMKDYDEYDPYTFPGARATDSRFIDEGWQKAYRGNYYLNLGLQYQPNKDLTIGVVGYYLLGIFDKDLNKRNYIASNGDFRDYAPAVAVSVAYKF